MALFDAPIAGAPSSTSCTKVGIARPTLQHAQGSATFYASMLLHSMMFWSPSTGNLMGYLASPRFDTLPQPKTVSMRLILGIAFSLSPLALQRGGSFCVLVSHLIESLVVRKKFLASLVFMQWNAVLMKQARQRMPPCGSRAALLISSQTIAPLKLWQSSLEA